MGIFISVAHFSFYVTSMPIHPHDLQYPSTGKKWLLQNLHASCKLLIFFIVGLKKEKEFFRAGEILKMSYCSRKHFQD